MLKTAAERRCWQCLTYSRRRSQIRLRQLVSTIDWPLYPSICGKLRVCTTAQTHRNVSGTQRWVSEVPVEYIKISMQAQQSRNGRQGQAALRKFTRIRRVHIFADAPGHDGSPTIDRTVRTAAHGPHGPRSLAACLTDGDSSFVCEEIEPPNQVLLKAVLGNKCSLIKNSSS